VLKRAILLHKGVPEDELFLVIGYDMVKRELHALIWSADGLMDDTADRLLAPADLDDMVTPEFAFREGQSYFYGLQAPAPAPEPVEDA
jgi:hypothetical protein